MVDKRYVTREGKRTRTKEGRAPFNIMKEFSIQELSAVDRPAQGLATMSIMKRADADFAKVLPTRRDDESEDEFVSRFLSDTMAIQEFPSQGQRTAVAFAMARDMEKQKGDDEEDERRRRNRRSRTVKQKEGEDRRRRRRRGNDVVKRLALTSDVDGHAHLLMIQMPTDDPNGFEVELRGGVTDIAGSGGEFGMGHVHPWIRAENGNYEIGEAEGHTHELEVLSKAFSDFLIRKMEEGGKLGPHDKFSSDAAGSSGGGRETQMEDDMSDSKTAADQAVQKRLDALESDLTLAKAYGELTDIEKAYANNLNTDEKNEFVAKSKTERSAILKAEKDADPVAYTTAAGDEIRKSAGKTVINMAKQIDAQNEIIAKNAKEALDNEIKKFVTDEMSCMAGDEDARILIAKAVHDIDNDDERDSALNALKAMNSKLAPAFETVGSTSGMSKGAVSAKDELQELADEIAKGDTNLSKEQAYVKALNSAKGQKLYSQMTAG